MNLKDLHGIVHRPCAGLEEDNAVLQGLIDAGWNVTFATACAAELTIKELTDAPISCITCIAWAAHGTG